MAVYTNTDIRWYLGQAAVACNAKSATLQNECAALDSTAICTTGWVEVIPGLKSGSFSLELMQDFDEAALDELMFPLVGVSGTPQSMSIGSAVGAPGYVWRSKVGSYTPITGNVGEIAGAAVSGVSTGAIARGQVIASDTTAVTASGTGTAVQVGALTASQEMLVGLHVPTVAGTTPTLAVTIQSDNASGFPSPTGRLTLSTATPTTNRAQIGTIAGAVTDDWWRVSYTITGSGGPSFNFAVVVGVRNI
jgi:hypothetical protein